MSYEQLLVALLASFWGSAGEVMGVELRPSDHLCRLGISWTLPFFGLSVECVFFEDVLNEITTFAPGEHPLNRPQILANRSKTVSRGCSKNRLKIKRYKMESGAALKRS